MSWLKAIWAAKKGMKAATDAKNTAVAEAKAYTDEIAEALASGATFKGSANTIADLPANASVGDTYVVVYGGGDATTVTNSMYIKTSGGWVNISTANPIGVYNKDDGKEYSLVLTVENGHLVTKMSV